MSEVAVIFDGKKYESTTTLAFREIRDPTVLAREKKMKDRMNADLRQRELLKWFGRPVK